jgi:predicted nuclease of predicted toxin-antitoxin system
MHIKVDEDLPAQATQRLRAEGYDASSVVEQKMGGWKDPQVWQAVQAHRQFLVTADKGFGDIRLYPPQTHGGVLLLRPDEDGIRPIIDLLDQVLAAYRVEMLIGCLTVATPRSIRIRRAH